MEYELINTHRNPAVARIYIKRPGYPEKMIGEIKLKPFTAAKIRRKFMASDQLRVTSKPPKVVKICGKSEPEKFQTYKGDQPA